MGVRMMINDTRIVDIQILHQHEEEQMGRRGASERAWGMIGDVGGTKIRPRPSWGQKCLTLREEGWF